MQEEKILRPRISAEESKCRHHLYNPGHMNPSTPNPGSHVIPSPPLSQRMLEERSRSRWALPMFLQHLQALLRLWQQLASIYQGPRSFIQETAHTDEIQSSLSLQLYIYSAMTSLKSIIPYYYPWKFWWKTPHLGARDGKRSSNPEWKNLGQTHCSFWVQHFSIPGWQ